MRRWRIWAVVGIAVSVGSLGEARIAQAFLGASAADLVYTPVAPCRIIDTRSAGAGGPIVPLVQRNFLVSGTTGFEALEAHTWRRAVCIVCALRDKGTGSARPSPPLPLARRRQCA